MTLRLLITFFITASVCQASDKWSIGVVPTDISRGYISISQDGFSSLSEAISQFPIKAPKAQLSHIWLALLLDKDLTAQEEIMTYLMKHYPKELSAAMQSSGNMHNPKVIPLQKPFKEAVISTTFVKSAGADLAKIGYKISAVGIEKFYLVKGTKSFSAAVWLMTTK